MKMEYVLAPCTTDADILENWDCNIISKQSSQKKFSWQKPGEGWFKLNTDGVVEASLASYDGVLQNSNGLHNLIFNS